VTTEGRGPVEKKRKGLVIVFTGDGKGKTTAAMGMALRAAGNRMRVRVLQFIKGAWKTGEVDAIKALGLSFTIERAGRGFTIDHLRDARITDEEHRAAGQDGIARAAELVVAEDVEVVVLDEILGAITAGVVDLPQVLDLIARKRPMLHLVLTGRNAPPEIVERADLVTEMRLVKHPFREQGVIAQRGVEF